MLTYTRPGAMPGVNEIRRTDGSQSLLSPGGRGSSRISLSFGPPETWSHWSASSALTSMDKRLTLVSLAEMHGQHRLRIGGNLRAAKEAGAPLDVTLESVSEGEPFEKLHVRLALHDGRDRLIVSRLACPSPQAIKAVPAEDRRRRSCCRSHSARRIIAPPGP